MCHMTRPYARANKFHDILETNILYIFLPDPNPKTHPHASSQHVGVSSFATRSDAHSACARVLLATCRSLRMSARNQGGKCFRLLYICLDFSLVRTPLPAKANKRHGREIIYSIVPYITLTDSRRAPFFLSNRK
jgi:hypothetical protein